MKVIMGALGSGKTTELIKIAAEGFYYIICQTKNDCMKISSRAKELGLDIPFPIDFFTFERGEFARGRGIKGFIIDDVDVLIEGILSRMCAGVPLKGVTYTELFKNS